MYAYIHALHIIETRKLATPITNNFFITSKQVRRIHVHVAYMVNIHTSGLRSAVILTFERSIVTNDKSPTWQID